MYQYAGDAVIVSWPIRGHLTSAAPVRCFFEMMRALEKKKAAYEDRYGAFPQLRGGIHAGDVVTTWVGEAKKELAFHGDTLNATARLEAMCGELGAQCLVSGFVHDQLVLPPHLGTRPMGEMDLRGRSAALPVFSVENLVPDR